MLASLTGFEPQYERSLERGSLGELKLWEHASRLTGKSSSPQGK